MCFIFASLKLYVSPPPQIIFRLNTSVGKSLLVFTADLYSDLIRYSEMGGDTRVHHRWYAQVTFIVTFIRVNTIYRPLILLLYQLGLKRTRSM
jgi:hypothetical protein